MIKTINLNDFRGAFIDMNREENFSYNGLNALFDYMEQLEEDIDEPIELDVIALCIEFTEYEDLEEIKENYEDSVDIETIDDLYNYTQVIEFDGGIILQDF